MTQKGKEKKRGALGLIRKAAGGILLAALLAGLYLTMVIGQPQEEREEAPAEQPLLTASPAQSIAAEGELRELVAAFPVPVMSFMSGSGMVFVSGNSTDTAFEGGFGRILTLYWQTAEGVPLILRSIYPARALELMEGKDYRFSESAGPALFGRTSVRMENADTTRLHVQTELGLYTVTVPEALAPELSGISRSIQLFTAE